MSKQIDALKLALEALKQMQAMANFECWNLDICDEAITAIREALAEQPAQQQCNPHPKAPHGFDRNSSHSADRYVCDCEGWDAYDAGYETGFSECLKRQEALDRMAENARELGLDYEPIVERVENSVGMGHKAWDMVEPKELAKAFHEALAEQPAQQQEPVAVVKALPMGHNQSDMHYAECQHLPVGTLLYTSPPASKPWVGLTQQDINIAFDDTQEGGGFDDFARAIEAKLREKNAPQQSKEDA